MTFSVVDWRKKRNTQQVKIHTTTRWAAYRGELLRPTFPKVNIKIPVLVPSELTASTGNIIRKVRIVLNQTSISSSII